jgi:hypothetical protein
MNVDQDIQSHKMKRLSPYVHWTYLFKLIEDKFTPSKTCNLKDKHKW